MKALIAAAPILLLALLVGSTPGLAEETDDSTWPELYTVGPSNTPYVALTFDDAPMPDTEELLDVLDELGVRATFFIEGIFASWRPELLRAITKAGHEIGNHSYDHPNMTRLSDDELVSQFELTNQIIESCIGIIPHLFRPPGGNYDSRVVDAAYLREMTTVLWTANASDYTGISSSRIADRILSRARPGGIILLHDGIGPTREALPEIVSTLRGRGYTFITVGEMIEMTHGECPWTEDEKPKPDLADPWPYL